MIIWFSANYAHVCHMKNPQYDFGETIELFERNYISLNSEQL